MPPGRRGAHSVGCTGRDGPLGGYQVRRVTPNARAPGPTYKIPQLMVSAETPNESLVSLPVKMRRPQSFESGPIETANKPDMCAFRVNRKVSALLAGLGPVL